MTLCNPCLTDMYVGRIYACVSLWLPSVPEQSIVGGCKHRSFQEKVLLRFEWYVTTAAGQAAHVPPCYYCR